MSKDHDLLIKRLHLKLNTTALEKAGRVCHNTPAKHNSSALHSVIAEVQHINQIQQTQQLIFHSHSETIRAEIAAHIHQHQELWLLNTPPSDTNRQATPSTPRQQLSDRITS